jgi:hypothetical protein
MCIRLSRLGKEPKELMENSSDALMVRVAVLCGQCSCGCPELYTDRMAEPDKRIVITDDFGQRVQMSAEQLQALLDEVRSGRLDDVVAAELTAG